MPQHKGRKRKMGGRPPMKKKEQDKEKFKRRKYTKNSYAIKEVVQEEETSDSSEEEQNDYDQLLQVFNKNETETKVASSDSSDDEDEVENLEEPDVEDEDLLGEEEEDIDEEENGDENVGSEGEDELEGESDGEDDVQGEDDDDIEEGKEEEEDEESDEGIEDDLEDNIDPFSAHFEVDLSEDMAKFVKEPKWKTSTEQYPLLGNVQFQLLDLPQKDASKRPTLEENSESKLVKFHKQLMEKVPPSPSTAKLYLKQNIQTNLRDADCGLTVSPLSTELLSIFSSYKDLCWGERTHQNGEDLRLAYTIHSVNHVLKTRTKILNNNQKHEKREDLDEALRDQGLCRPKVLMVVPFRESCRRIVNIMEKILFPQSKGNVANKKRFSEDFPEIETVRKNKPDDYYDTFAGDINDSFKLGLAVTKKTLKLYTDFYNSDIIIASPLGVRLVLGAEGERERNYDFLNSIEVLIFDQTEIFMMQNWDHIICILDDIHKQPQESRGTDYSRVRLWTLDGLNKFYRQSLIFSSTPTPEINSIFNRHCTNYFGKAKVMNPVETGSISRVFSDVSIAFHRVNTTSLKVSMEDKFIYFKKLIDSSFMKDEMDHVLIFYSSYVDFVKGRNWFKSANLDYAEISEYTKDNKMAKARDDFYHNSKHFLLYTERAHFYRRFSIKGIRHLIFYQLPVNPNLFTEMCNLQQEQFQNKRGGTQANMSCTVLYTKYDASRLAQCVGTEKAGTMINATKEKHVFTPGS